MRNDLCIIATGNPHQTPPLDSSAQQDNRTEAWLCFQKSLAEAGSPIDLISHELVRYPALAEQLRQLPDFPFFKQRYPLDLLDRSNIRRGYYDNLVQRCHHLFYQELLKTNRQIKYWFFNKEQPATPLIESFQLNADGWIKQCVISGLEWEILLDPLPHAHPAKYLDLHTWLSIDRRCTIRIEDAIPGSPLLALWIQEDHPNDRKTLLFWYNLDTRRQGQVTDAVNY